MSSVTEQTVYGLNKQIARIKELAARYPSQEIFVSLVFFNETVKPVFNRILPESLRKINFSDYAPEGSTSLNDAIIRSVSDLRNEAGAEIGSDESSVVVTIITDGYENSSVNFNDKDVASQIKSLEETDKWIFSLIGLNLNASSIAEKLGIRKKNVMHFDFYSNAVFKKIDDSIEAYIGSKENGIIKNEFFENEAG